MYLFVYLFCSSSTNAPAALALGRQSSFDKGSVTSTAHGVLRQAAMLTTDSFYLHFALSGVNYASARSFICWCFHDAPMKVCTQASCSSFLLPSCFLTMLLYTISGPFGEKVLMYLLSRAILHREPKGDALKVIQDCDNLWHEDFHRPSQLGLPKVSVPSEAGGLGLALCYRGSARLAHLLPMTVNFYTDPKSATPSPLPMPTQAL